MTTPPASSALEDLLHTSLRRAPRRTVGLAAGVIADGTPATHGIGRTAADGIAPDERTFFQIGSVTKVFTALALADAVVRGALSLDTPLATLLPETPDRRITLGSLATHTSGLPRLPKGLRRTARRNRLDPYRDFDSAALRAALAAARVRAEPGARYRYSNFGYGLLGQALGRHAGTAFEDLIALRVTGPLGLVDTLCTLDRDRAARKATGHARPGRPVPDWHMGALPGAGALWSTVSDMLRLLQACLHPDATVLAEALRLAQAPHHPVNGRLGIGLGWHVVRLGRATTAVLHNGGTGGFRSFVGFLPAADAGVAVLANGVRSVDGLGFRLLRELEKRRG